MAIVKVNENIDSSYERNFLSSFLLPFDLSFVIVFITILNQLRDWRLLLIGMILLRMIKTVFPDKSARHVEVASRSVPQMTRDGGKPAVRRGRKVTGPDLFYPCGAAGLPTGMISWSRQSGEPLRRISP